MGVVRDFGRGDVGDYLGQEEANRSCLERMGKEKGYVVIRCCGSIGSCLALTILVRNSEGATRILGLANEELLVSERGEQANPTRAASVCNPWQAFAVLERIICPRTSLRFFGGAASRQWAYNQAIVRGV